MDARTKKLPNAEKHVIFNYRHVSDDVKSVTLRFKDEEEMHEWLGQYVQQNMMSEEDIIAKLLPTDKKVCITNVLEIQTIFDNILKLESKGEGEVKNLLRRDKFPYKSSSKYDELAEAEDN